MVRRLAVIAVLFTLAIPGAVFAKDCEIDTSSNGSIVKSAKACGFNISNAGIGKKVPAPRKPQTLFRPKLRRDLFTPHPDGQRFLVVLRLDPEIDRALLVDNWDHVP